MIAHGMHVWTHPISSGSSARYGTPSGRVPLTWLCTFLTRAMTPVAASVVPNVVRST
jgi:hypothetical protein